MVIYIFIGREKLNSYPCKKRSSMREWRYSSIHSSSRNEMEIWGSASLPSFFTPEGIAPATFRKWKCMWTSFPRKFFWNVTPCSLVGGYWSFRETWFSPILSWRRMLGHIIYWYRVLFIFFFSSFHNRSSTYRHKCSFGTWTYSFLYFRSSDKFPCSSILSFFIQNVFWGASQVA